MKVIIYSRCSTDDKEQDTSRQVMKCEAYCKMYDHEILGVFQEYCSGDTSPLSRPLFSRGIMLNPDGIIIFSMDRLSRQHPSKIMALLNQFKGMGIKIISTTEPLFNMESDMAEPMQYFITWWNNYFLKKLKIDIKSGMDRARAQGKIIGKPRLKFNEFRAYQLLFIDKVSLSHASKEIGVSRATLCRFKRVALKSPQKYMNIQEYQNGVVMK